MEVQKVKALTYRGKGEGEIRDVGEEEKRIALLTL